VLVSSKRQHTREERWMPLPQEPIPVPLHITPERGILTIDLEYWHSVSCIPATRYLLALLADRGVSATFFVVGRRAPSLAGLLCEIRDAGHELACHGFLHRSPAELTPERFRDDVVRARDAIESITGTAVYGFRAPIFGVVRESQWVFDVLAESGFRYDSSVFPFAGRRYGLPGFPLGPVVIERPSGSLVELPLSTVAVGGRTWPVAGGGYFRLLPYAVIRAAVAATRRDGRPFVAYFHPYEFEPRRLRHVPADGLPWLGARADEARYNLGRRTMATKLARLLDEFSFTSAAQALETAGRPLSSAPERAV
jgi:polysaccharide deacetylase family protein (PEP-CTERM system associated)